jgi:serine/threonine protein phosphatase PrpC
VQLDHEPGHHFFAVFDGHGGKDVAQYCSQRAHQVQYSLYRSFIVLITLLITHVNT